MLEAPARFYGLNDPDQFPNAFQRFPPEILHVLSVGVLKKTYELLLDLIKSQGSGSKRLQRLNDRARKLDHCIWGMTDMGCVKFKRRPDGITKISKLPGYEFYCLIWQMLSSIVHTDEIFGDAAQRNGVVQVLLGCL